MNFALLFCILGLGLFLYRLQPWRQRKVCLNEDTPFVSIIIPCRNEEKNLPALLTSLVKLNYPNFEIIVVDDSSTDRTVAVAEEYLSSHFASQVLRAPEKPPSWGGKNWPCWIGSQTAKGELLLFTDADTKHSEMSLRHTSGFLLAGKHDLITVPPVHSCALWWERFFGLFYLLPLVATSFRSEPTKERLFAIGQYLLVTRESYETLDGHKGVAASLAEDIDLATRWLAHSKSYGVFADAQAYEVQMYQDFKSFFTGWKRLLRLGLPRSSFISFAEVTLVCNLFCFSLISPRAELIAVFFLGLSALAWSQRQHGRFYWFGALAAPISVLAFLILTIAASLESLLKKDLKWHGRNYQNSLSDS